MSEFAISHFAFDGELLGHSVLSAQDLSPRWVLACRDLLEVNGPVFSSELANFTVDCAGAMCRFMVGGQTLYLAAFLMGIDAENDRKAVGWFNRQFAQNALPAVPDGAPAVLLMNTLAPGISDIDREALFELACHFGGAYLDWSRE